MRMTTVRLAFFAPALALLGGCTEVPILKTNCWSNAGQNVTVSTMGLPQGTAQVARAAGEATALALARDADAPPCR